MMSFKNDANAKLFVQSKLLDCFFFLFQKDLES